MTCKKNRRQQVVDALEASDGMTIKQLRAATGITGNSLNSIVERAPTVFIDRYQRNPDRGMGRPEYVPVYCAAPVPQDCPHPTRENGPAAPLAATTGD